VEGPQQKFPNDEQCRRGTPWEGLLLNLSSNCESRRVALPAPRLEQSREEPPSGRADEMITNLAFPCGCGFLSSVHAFLLTYSLGCTVRQLCRLIEEYGVEWPGFSVGLYW